MACNWTDPHPTRIDLSMAQIEHKDLPLPDLLESLQNCNACQLSTICDALAYHLQQLTSSDLPALANVLISTLRLHVSTGAMPDVVSSIHGICDNWDGMQSIPKETVCALLRTMMKNANVSNQFSRKTSLRSRSTPAILNRCHLQCQTEVEVGQSSRINSKVAIPIEKSPVDEHLPIGDIRMLRTLLHMLRQCTRVDTLADVHPLHQGRPDLTTHLGMAADFKTHPEDAISTTNVSEAWSHALEPDVCSSVPDTTPRSRIDFYSITTSDSSVSPQHRNRTERCDDWYSDRFDVDAPEQFENRTEERTELPIDRISISSRLRCKSLPAPRRCHGGQIIETVSVPAHHDQVFSFLGASDLLEAKRALQKECEVLRNTQVVCLQAVRETANMVVEMHNAAQEERQAREQEMQERMSLQADLRMMSSHMQMLAQGQQELQRCMMAMCAQWSNNQSQVCSGNTFPALCSSTSAQRQPSKATEFITQATSGAQMPLRSGQWQRTDRNRKTSRQRAERRSCKAGSNHSHETAQKVPQHTDRAPPLAHPSSAMQFF